MDQVSKVTFFFRLSIDRVGEPWKTFATDFPLPHVGRVESDVVPIGGPIFRIGHTLISACKIGFPLLYKTSKKERWNTPKILIIKVLYCWDDV